tara:strand:+ start:816 stop:1847 length:1032 start_codon:yes stop_codon:yes gene_type:complete
MASTPAHPAEDFELVSGWIILAGFLLMAGVLILVAFIAAGRIDPDTERNFFGQSVSIADVEMRYRSTFAPGAFMPGMKEHNEQKGSVVYRWVWIFLIGWLFMSGIYLILAGALGSIEVYRVDALFNSTAYVSIALVLCGVWTYTFREGSKTSKQQADEDAMRVKLRVAAAGNEQIHEPSASEPVLHGTRTKTFYLAISNMLLFAAFLLALVATSSLQAWTLPSEQYGILLFLGPGLGLLTGWLLYAFLLNYGIVIGVESCPDGLGQVPEGESEYAYQASLMFPLVGAGVVFLCAVLIPDPTIPLPLAIVLLLFTPKYRNNLIAVCIATLGVALGGLRVRSLRS